MVMREKRARIISMAKGYLAKEGVDTTRYDLAGCVDKIIENGLTLKKDAQTIAAAVAVICQMAGISQAVQAADLLSVPQERHPDFHRTLDSFAEEAARGLSARKRDVLRIHNALVPVPAS